MMRFLLKVVALALVLSPAAVGAQDAEFISVDEEFSAIAEEVPGFGGLFQDEDGNAFVYLTNPSEAAPFEQFGENVTVLEGKYDWRELATWRDDLLDILNQPGVVFLDIDESKNRIVLGLEDKAEEGARLAVENSLSSFGVPTEAVEMVATPGIQLHAKSLRARYRPIPGGTQISWNRGSSTFLCTVGFNARLGNNRGFVTNSHCSGSQGGNQGTSFWQPNRPANNSGRIAVETRDPGYFTGSGCPAGRRCRFSDSAFARYVGGAAGQRGRIARPTGINSLTVNPNGARFTITGTRGAPSFNNLVVKVGRTTGWTQGRVTNTNVAVNVAGTNLTLLGSYIVAGRSAGGDSGSPVFLRNNNRATLVGILWGGDNAGTIFVLSSYGNIRRELGNLTEIR